jgi:integrase/recombinase XerD
VKLSLTTYSMPSPRAAVSVYFYSIFRRSARLREAASFSRIVRAALERADIVLPPVVGAHLIRHRLATQLVGQRRPINEIVDLLGHRSIDTTAVYGKVALPQLADVARPFSGDMR